MRRTARAVLEVLDAADVTVTATSRTQLSAHPTWAIDGQPLALLKALKPRSERVSARRICMGRRRTAACARCDSEFRAVPVRRVPCAQ